MVSAPFSPGASRRERLRASVAQVLGDLPTFSTVALKRPLRPHQLAIARGLLPHLIAPSSLDDPTFLVEMSRQAGKNELSAHLEAWLLTRHQKSGGQVVKGSPTFQPQTINSILRLQDMLKASFLTKASRAWRSSYEFMVVVGLARAIFFSAERKARRLGATASLLMEIDEAQDVDATIYDKDFAPMRATTNAPVIFYGTAWTDDTLLARVRSRCKELQARDGIRRHFRFDWRQVADGIEAAALARWRASGAEGEPPGVSAYRRFVQGQMEQLGEGHPIFKTQYALEEVEGAGKLFPQEYLDKLAGYHPRYSEPPDPNFSYVAALDTAGAAEQLTDTLLTSTTRRRDSSVLTIGRITWMRTPISDIQLPKIEVLDHFAWTGDNHAAIHDQLVGILKHKWKVKRLISDNTGVGAGLTSFLTRQLGEGRVVAFDFNQHTKSRLGYNLLAMVGTGRLTMYAEFSPSQEAEQFWAEVEAARIEIKSDTPGRLMDFFVPERGGDAGEAIHDDFLVSLALLAWAGEELPAPPEATAAPFLPRAER